jgi:flavin-dependent dehydrogenase
MIDVIVAGAGPAGSVAALVLARAGARVVVVDREAFPRDKLCGDTLNPGAVALIRSLGLGPGPLDHARPLRGMRVSGPGASIRATYGDGHAGLAIRRRDLDGWLLERAIAAGARFEGGLTVRRALVDETGGQPTVRGLVLATRGDARHVHRMPALVTLAADGRRSAVARSLGLATHPAAGRRWAFGTYATGVADAEDMGEMHLRRGFYLGIAPVSDGVCNVCVVTGPRPAGRTPEDVMRRAIAGDAELAARLDGAAFIEPVRVLGPLAVDVAMPGAPGLLLAGDAAGFVDPMTGDGLHLAMQSALLAAEAARLALERGVFDGAVDELARRRRAAIGGKIRFNRVLRALSSSPAALRLAARGATLAPGLVRAAVRYAGDVR